MLRREAEIFRAQRKSLPPHRRPDYRPEQRLAILQLRGLRGWSIKKTGIIPVQARVRAPYLNDKIERAFRTFRIWWRLVLTGLMQRGIQRRLDDMAAWFNEHRPHSALHGRTPQEAWEGRVLAEPVPIRERDQLQPQIKVCRRHYHGDPRLPIVEISVRLAA